MDSCLFPTERLHSIRPRKFALCGHRRRIALKHRPINPEPRICILILRQITHQILSFHLNLRSQRSSQILLIHLIRFPRLSHAVHILRILALTRLLVLRLQILLSLSLHRVLPIKIIQILQDLRFESLLPHIFLDQMLIYPVFDQLMLSLLLLQLAILLPQPLLILRPNLTLDICLHLLGHVLSIAVLIEAFSHVDAIAFLGLKGCLGILSPVKQLV